MSLNRPGTKEELFCYPEIRTALGHVPEHSALALIKRVDHAGFPVPSQEAADDARIYYRLTSGHSGQAVHERTNVCDVVFQQVANASAHGLQKLAGVARLGIGGQDEDADLRVKTAQLGRRPDA